MTPVYLTSTFAQSAPGVHRGFDYSRTANPTRAALEANLAALEGAAHGVAFASGSAATHAVVSLLSAGDHVVLGHDVYGGTYRLLDRVFSRFGVSFTTVDTSDLDRLRDAIRPATRLVWFESPTNPLLETTDVAAAAALAKAKGLLVAVDNTFATPYLQTPLALGADLVVHSTTKYLSGHSDVVGGAVVTSDADLAARLRFLQNAVGAVPSPMDCFLVLRGTKTLAVRMERHCDNAEAVARYLAGHPRVARVHYPGLPGAKGREVAVRQMRRFGGVVSVELDADLETAKRFASSTRLFTLAESLGGVESLLDHPASMTHGSIPPAERRARGLSDGLLRLSVGLEDADDLRDDLADAFRRALN
jgi:cystathionine gamma-lyase